MKYSFFPAIGLLLLSHSLHSQAHNPQDGTAAALGSIKLQLQGVWAGPDETFFFRFRGDSVKEWESEGTDSAIKPYCSYHLSSAACDTFSRSDTGTTGFYLLISCVSPDDVETRCYTILSLNKSELKLGYQGKFDESGYLRKLNVQ